MVKYEGVSIEELVSWWVCLGCDEDFVFLGHIEIFVLLIFLLVCTAWYTKLI
jgi:hypothetical protein